MPCNSSNQNNIVNNNDPNLGANNFMAQIEDQTDYKFIQRIIQELTQSCALPLPIPASAIPPLILQAAQFFWENYDGAVEQRMFVIRNTDINKCGLKKTIKLPEQIVSVFGVHKANNNFVYGAMGDFSLERMIVNNSLLTAGVGGSMKNAYGDGTGFNLTDITAALYEVQTYKSLFEAPVTYDYNYYSNILVLLGDLGYSDLVIECFKRVKIQDLYKLYYFFRYVVCLAKRSLTQIMGTIEFKMPGGTVINYQQFRDTADTEIQEIIEWINNNHSTDYFFNTNTI